MRRFDAGLDHEEYLRGDLGLITSPEVASILGISVDAVYIRVKLGTLVPKIRGTKGHSWFSRKEIG